MELNLSNKIKKNKIGGFYEAVCWLKVWPNWRVWADTGNTKDIAEESQKTHPRPKKCKIRKLRCRMGTMVRGSAELGRCAKSDTRICSDSIQSGSCVEEKKFSYQMWFYAKSLVNPLVNPL